MALYLIKNNKKKLITKKVVHRKNIFSKGTGLMFHSKIKDEVHIFHFKKPFKIPLTMIFVFFTIDVVFLKNMKVVETKKDFKPFTNYKSKKEADMFIELPRGYIEKKNITKGTKLHLD